jgi:hypothetical protein
MQITGGLPVAVATDPPSATPAPARRSKMQEMCLSCPATADVKGGNNDHQECYPGEIVIGRARCEPPHGDIRRNIYMKDIGDSMDRNATLSPDKVASQLRDFFSDPDRGVERIVALIRKHPWLAAETLRRSNTVVYGGVQRTTDIYEAVNRLGFYEVYDIVADSADKRLIPLEAMDPTGNLSHP